MWLEGQVETTKSHHDIWTLDLQHTKGLVTIPQQRWVLLRKERLIEDTAAQPDSKWKLSGGVQRSIEHSLQQQQKNKQKGHDDAEQAALPSTGTAALPSGKTVFLYPRKGVFTGRCELDLIYNSG